MSDDVINPTVWYDHDNIFDPGDSFFVRCAPVSVGSVGRAVVAMLYRLFFFLGFIGNGLVVFVFVKYRKLTNLTNICLLNLALSDLLVALTLPFWSHYFAVDNWIFGEPFCRVTCGSKYIGFFSSFFFMIALMLDRYMVIMHSHRAAHYRTVRFGIALTVVVWMLSLGLALPGFIFTKVPSESDWQWCSYNSSPLGEDWELYRILVMNITGFVIPLLVMIVCCSRIIPTLVKTRTTKKHRMLKLIITIVVLFLIFWTPYNSVRFLIFLNYIGRFSISCFLLKNWYVLNAVTETLAYFHCCVKPIIYAFVGQKFMKMRLAAAEEMDT